ncbi:hypothetical protein KAR91_53810 [Candidatus Pacearchaeota archaeon]|nr:hypothetical protein [Candidatus Pacearchaeota archaeon]
MASEPSIINIPERAWLKIDSGLMIGSLYVLDNSFIYYKTYRPIGDLAPSDLILPDDLDNFTGIRIFDNTNIDKLTFFGNVDLYIYCFNPDPDSIDSGKILYFPDEDKSSKKVDTFVQDQHTFILDLLLSRKLNPVTLAANTIIGSQDVTFEPGHGFIIGDWFESWEDDLYFQTEVINVVGDVITLAVPVGIPQTSAAVAWRIDIDMAKDGSISDLIYDFQPQQIGKWDIVRAIGVIVHTTAGDDSKFGNLAALTNGVFYRAFNGDLSVFITLFNVKVNGGYRLRMYDVFYSDKAGPGLFSTSFRRTFGGQDKTGVVIRMDADQSDKVESIIRDDLSTLTSFQMVVQGHQVD